MKIKKLSFFFVCFLFCILSSAQSVSVDTLAKRLGEQVYQYPQEKVHVMTDKSAYFGGDTVWFRAFVVDASTHVPVKASKYVYVELTNAFDSLVSRVKIMERGGVYAGYLPLEAQMAEGEYTLTAYTMFMENAGKDYFFRKNLYVSSPFAVDSEMKTTFQWKGDRLECTALLADKRTGTMRPWESMQYTTCDGAAHERVGRNGPAPFTLKDKETAKPYVLITFGGYSRYFRLPYKAGADFDVSFHPEGGYLVPGSRCRVAFKAVNEDGRGVAVQGVVSNGGGQTVARMATLHAGMGIFSFTPLATDTYTATVTTADGRQKTFSLPLTNAVAAVLHIDTRGDSLRIRTAGRVTAGSMVIVQQRGRMLASAPISEGTVQTFAKQWFTPGVAQVLLLDAEAHVLSERLVFVRDHSQRKTTVTTDKPSYGRREKVVLNIDISGYDNREASVAVAVTDSRTVPADSTSIQAQLLLQGDLKGVVERPWWYFTQADAHTDEAIDALMLTQGWRRYDVPAVLQGHYTYPKVPLEAGQEISGVVKTTWGTNFLTGASVSLVAPKMNYSSIATTDDKGVFRFSEFNLPDNTTYIIMAYNKKGKKLQNITINSTSYPLLCFSPLNSDNRGDIQRFVKQNERQFTSDISMRQFLLDGITVIGHKKREAGDIYTNLASNSFDDAYIKENHLTSWDEVIRKIAGMEYRGGNLYFRKRPVFFAVDGWMEDGSPGSKKAFDDLKDKYPFSVVSKIDYLPPQHALIFSSSAATLGGVLMITTKNGPELHTAPLLSPYVRVTTPLGYQQPRAFYSPKYVMKESKNLDLRSTVFWQPDVLINEKGKAVVEFYSADVENTLYRVSVEGLTVEGSIIEDTTEVKVN